MWHVVCIGAEWLATRPETILIFFLKVTTNKMEHLVDVVRVDAEYLATLVASTTALVRGMDDRTKVTIQNVVNRVGSISLSADGVALEDVKAFLKLNVFDPADISISEGSVESFFEALDTVLDHERWWWKREYASLDKVDMSNRLSPSRFLQVVARKIGHATAVKRLHDFTTIKLASSCRLCSTYYDRLDAFDRVFIPFLVNRPEFDIYCVNPTERIKVFEVDESREAMSTRTSLNQVLHLGLLSELYDKGISPNCMKVDAMEVCSADAGKDSYVDPGDCDLTALREFDLANNRRSIQDSQRFKTVQRAEERNRRMVLSQKTLAKMSTYKRASNGDLKWVEDPKGAFVRVFIRMVPYFESKTHIHMETLRHLSLKSSTTSLPSSSQLVRTVDGEMVTLFGLKDDGSFEFVRARGLVYKNEAIMVSSDSGGLGVKRIPLSQEDYIHWIERMFHAEAVQISRNSANEYWLNRTRVSDMTIFRVDVDGAKEDRTVFFFNSGRMMPTPSLLVPPTQDAGGQTLHVELDASLVRVSRFEGTKTRTHERPIHEVQPGDHHTPLHLKPASMIPIMKDRVGQYTTLKNDTMTFGDEGQETYEVVYFGPNVSGTLMMREDAFFVSGDAGETPIVPPIESFKYEIPPLSRVGRATIFCCDPPVRRGQSSTERSSFLFANISTTRDGFVDSINPVSTQNVCGVSMYVEKSQTTLLELCTNKTNEVARIWYEVPHRRRVNIAREYFQRAAIQSETEADFLLRFPVEAWRILQPDSVSRELHTMFIEGALEQLKYGLAVVESHFSSMLFCTLAKTPVVLCSQAPLYGTERVAMGPLDNTLEASPQDLDKKLLSVPDEIEIDSFDEVELKDQGHGYMKVEYPAKLDSVFVFNGRRFYNRERPVNLALADHLTYDFGSTPIKLPNLGFVVKLRPTRYSYFKKMWTMPQMNIRFGLEVRPRGRFQDKFKELGVKVVGLTVAVITSALVLQATVGLAWVAPSLKVAGQTINLIATDGNEALSWIHTGITVGAASLQTARVLGRLFGHEDEMDVSYAELSDRTSRLTMGNLIYALVSAVKIFADVTSKAKEVQGLQSSTGKAQVVSKVVTTEATRSQNTEWVLSNPPIQDLMTNITSNMKGKSMGIDVEKRLEAAIVATRDLYQPGYDLQAVANQMLFLQPYRRLARPMNFVFGSASVLAMTAGLAVVVIMSVPAVTGIVSGIATGIAGVPALAGVMTGAIGSVGGYVSLGAAALGGAFASVSAASALAGVQYCSRYDMETINIASTPLLYNIFMTAQQQEAYSTGKVRIEQSVTRSIIIKMSSDALKFFGDTNAVIELAARPAGVVYFSNRQLLDSKSVVDQGQFRIAADKLRPDGTVYDGPDRGLMYVESVKLQIHFITMNRNSFPLPTTTIWQTLRVATQFMRGRAEKAINTLRSFEGIKVRMIADDSRYSHSVANYHVYNVQLPFPKPQSREENILRVQSSNIYLNLQEVVDDPRPITVKLQEVSKFVIYDMISPYEGMKLIGMLRRGLNEEVEQSGLRWQRINRNTPIYHPLAKVQLSLEEEANKNDFDMGKLYERLNEGPLVLTSREWLTFGLDKVIIDENAVIGIDAPAAADGEAVETDRFKIDDCGELFESMTALSKEFRRLADAKGVTTDGPLEKEMQIMIPITKRRRYGVQPGYDRIRLDSRDLDVAGYLTTSWLYANGISPHFYRIESVFRSNYGECLVTDKMQGDMYNPYPIFTLLQTACSNSGMPRDLIPTYAELMDNIIIQALFTLLTFQTVFHGMHNDLHLASFGLKIVDNTTYREKPLNKMQHFVYKFNDKTYCVPNLGIIVKLGNFSYSTFSVDQATSVRVVSSETAAQRNIDGTSANETELEAAFQRATHASGGQFTDLDEITQHRNDTAYTDSRFKYMRMADPNNGFEGNDTDFLKSKIGAALKEGIGKLLNNVFPGILGGENLVREMERRAKRGLRVNYDTSTDLSFLMNCMRMHPVYQQHPLVYEHAMMERRDMYEQIKEGMQVGNKDGFSFYIELTADETRRIQDDQTVVCDEELHTHIKSSLMKTDIRVTSVDTRAFIKSNAERRFSKAELMPYMGQLPPPDKLPLDRPYRVFTNSDNPKLNPDTHYRSLLAYQQDKNGSIIVDLKNLLSPQRVVKSPIQIEYLFKDRRRATLRGDEIFRFGEDFYLNNDGSPLFSSPAVQTRTQTRLAHFALLRPDRDEKNMAGAIALERRYRLMEDSIGGSHIVAEDVYTGSKTLNADTTLKVSFPLLSSSEINSDVEWDQKRSVVKLQFERLTSRTPTSTSSAVRIRAGHVHRLVVEGVPVDVDSPPRRAHRPIDAPVIVAARTTSRSPHLHTMLRRRLIKPIDAYDEPPTELDKEYDVFMRVSESLEGLERIDGLTWVTVDTPVGLRRSRRSPPAELVDISKMNPIPSPVSISQSVVSYIHGVRKMNRLTFVWSSPSFSHSAPSEDTEMLHFAIPLADDDPIVQHAIQEKMTDFRVFQLQMRSFEEVGAVEFFGVHGLVWHRSSLDDEAAPSPSDDDRVENERLVALLRSKSVDASSRLRLTPSEWLDINIRLDPNAVVVDDGYVYAPQGQHAIGTFASSVVAANVAGLDVLYIGKQPSEWERLVSLTVESTNLPGMTDMHRYINARLMIDDSGSRQEMNSIYHISDRPVAHCADKICAAYSYTAILNREIGRLLPDILIESDFGLTIGDTIGWANDEYVDVNGHLFRPIASMEEALYRGAFYNYAPHSLKTNVSSLCLVDRWNRGRRNDHEIIMTEGNLTFKYERLDEFEVVRASNSFEDFEIASHSFVPSVNAARRCLYLQPCEFEPAGLDFVKDLLGSSYHELLKTETRKWSALRKRYGIDDQRNFVCRSEPIVSDDLLERAAANASEAVTELFDTLTGLPLIRTFDVNESDDTLMLFCKLSDRRDPKGNRKCPKDETLLDKIKKAKRVISNRAFDVDIPSCVSIKPYRVVSPANALHLSWVQTSDASNPPRNVPETLISNLALHLERGRLQLTPEEWEEMAIPAKSITTSTVLTSSVSSSIRFKPSGLSSIELRRITVGYDSPMGVGNWAKMLGDPSPIAKELSLSKRVIEAIQDKGALTFEDVSSYKMEIVEGRINQRVEELWEQRSSRGPKLEAWKRAILPETGRYWRRINAATTGPRLTNPSDVSMVEKLARLELPITLTDSTIDALDTHEPKIVADDTHAFASLTVMLFEDKCSDGLFRQYAKKSDTLDAIKADISTKSVQQSEDQRVLETQKLHIDQVDESLKNLDAAVLQESRNDLMAQITSEKARINTLDHEIETASDPLMLTLKRRRQVQKIEELKARSESMDSTLESLPTQRANLRSQLEVLTNEQAEVEKRIKTRSEEIEVLKEDRKHAESASKMAKERQLDACRERVLCFELPSLTRAEVQSGLLAAVNEDEKERMEKLVDAVQTPQKMGALLDDILKSALQTVQADIVEGFSQPSVSSPLKDQPQVEADEQGCVTNEALLLDAFSGKAIWTCRIREAQSDDKDLPPWTGRKGTTATLDAIRIYFPQLERMAICTTNAGFIVREIEGEDNKTADASIVGYFFDPIQGSTKKWRELKDKEFEDRLTGESGTMYHAARNPDHPKRFIHEFAPLFVHLDLHTDLDAMSEVDFVEINGYRWKYVGKGALARFLLVDNKMYDNRDVFGTVYEEVGVDEKDERLYDSKQYKQTIDGRLESLVYEFEDIKCERNNGMCGLLANLSDSELRIAMENGTRLMDEPQQKVRRAWASLRDRSSQIIGTIPIDVTRYARNRTMLTRRPVQNPSFILTEDSLDQWKLRNVVFRESSVQFTALNLAIPVTWDRVNPHPSCLEPHLKVSTIDPQCSGVTDFCVDFHHAVTRGSDSSMPWPLAGAPEIGQLPMRRTTGLITATASTGERVYLPIPSTKYTPTLSNPKESTFKLTSLQRLQHRLDAETVTVLMTGFADTSQTVMTEARVLNRLIYSYSDRDALKAITVSPKYAAAVETGNSVAPRVEEVPVQYWFDSTLEARPHDLLYIDGVYYENVPRLTPKIDMEMIIFNNVKEIQDLSAVEVSAELQMSQVEKEDTKIDDSYEVKTMEETTLLIYYPKSERDIVVEGQLSQHAVFEIDGKLFKNTRSRKQTIDVSSRSGPKIRASASDKREDGVDAAMIEERMLHEYAIDREPSLRVLSMFEAMNAGTIITESLQAFRDSSGQIVNISTLDQCPRPFDQSLLFTSKDVGKEMRVSMNDSKMVVHVDKIPRPLAQRSELHDGLAGRILSIADGRATIVDSNNITHTFSNPMIRTIFSDGTHPTAFDPFVARGTTVTHAPNLLEKLKIYTSGSMMESFTGNWNMAMAEMKLSDWLYTLREFEIPISFYPTSLIYVNGVYYRNRLRHRLPCRRWRRMRGNPVTDSYYLDAATTAIGDKITKRLQVLYDGQKSMRQSTKNRIEKHLTHVDKSVRELCQSYMHDMIPASIAKKVIDRYKDAEDSSDDDVTQKRRAFIDNVLNVVSRFVPYARCDEVVLDDNDMPRERQMITSNMFVNVRTDEGDLRLIPVDDETAFRYAPLDIVDYDKRTLDLDDTKFEAVLDYLDGKLSLAKVADAFAAKEPVALSTLCRCPNDDNDGLDWYEVHKDDIDADPTVVHDEFGLQLTKRNPPRMNAFEKDEFGLNDVSNDTIIEAVDDTAKARFYRPCPRVTELVTDRAQAAASCSRWRRVPLSHQQGAQSIALEALLQDLDDNRLLVRDTTRDAILNLADGRFWTTTTKEPTKRVDLAKNESKSTFYSRICQALHEESTAARKVTRIELTDIELISKIDEEEFSLDDVLGGLIPSGLQWETIDPPEDVSVYEKLQIPKLAEHLRNGETKFSKEQWAAFDKELHLWHIVEVDGQFFRPSQLSVRFQPFVSLVEERSCYALDSKGACFVPVTPTVLRVGGKQKSIDASPEKVFTMQSDTALTSNDIVFIYGNAYYNRIMPTRACKHMHLSEAQIHHAVDNMVFSANNVDSSLFGVYSKWLANPPWLISTAKSFFNAETTPEANELEKAENASQTQKNSGSAHDAMTVGGMGRRTKIPLARFLMHSSYLNGAKNGCLDSDDECILAGLVKKKNAAPLNP